MGLKKNIANYKFKKIELNVTWNSMYKKVNHRALKDEWIIEFSGKYGTPKICSKTLLMQIYWKKIATFWNVLNYWKASLKEYLK